MGHRYLKAFAVLAVLMFPFVSAASIDVNVKYGDHGEAVRELQAFLIAKHLLSGRASGNFFGLTLSAVRKYQQSVNLPATGFVGAMTRSAINTDELRAAAPDAATSTDDSVHAVAAQVQQLLQQISTLQNNTKAATSSISQSYATSSAQAHFDASWSDAIVNLFCTNRYGGYDSFSSGTGVIVDPRGVILTNAHVGFDSLFANWPNPSLEECSVRVGSPATNLYTATILYIPDAWVRQEIANTFSYDATTTVGEKDYALLLITGRTNPTAQLPSAFAYLPIFQGGALPVNTSTYLMGYAAENLSTESLLRNLYLLSTAAKVDAQRPIGHGTLPDVIAFSGPVTSQHGASGGAVVTNDGKVAGLMTFLDKDYGDITSQRVLNAITTSYIMRDFTADNGTSLSAFLATPDLASVARAFNAGKASQYQDMYAKSLKARGYSVPGVN